MADTNFRGPVVSMGSLEVQSGTAATIEPFDGPNAAYQGYAFLDVRGVPYPSEGLQPGRVPAFLGGAHAFMVDNKPSAANATALGSSQTATSLLPLTLATVTVGIGGANAGNPVLATNIPIIPQGTTSVATAAIALDFGFTTGTTVANSSTVNVADNTQLQVGQWIIIGGAGNSTNTQPFFTQVQSITTTNFTGVTCLPVPPAAISNGPIGQANLYGATLLPPGTQFGPSTAAPNAHNPNAQAGLLRVHNPREMIARNVSIGLATGGVATAVTFLVTGWDVWRQPMSELITSPATTSATTTWGKKAFKYIAAITPQSASTAQNSYGAGFGDVFGMALRADAYEQTSIFWNGCNAGTSLGFTAAATTAPASNTTGDVRGTIQVSTNGGGSGYGVTNATVSNGTARLTIVQNSGVWNMITATPNNTVPMFGVANSTN